MPSLTEHKASKITKLLLMGDSKTGKTSSLASLVAAGYALRILDYDNLLESLVSAVERLGCKDRLAQVDFLTLRDKLRSSGGSAIPDGIPRAFSDGLKALDRWPGLDGKPGEWGENTVVVVDSLTRMSDAAYYYCQSIAPTVKDPRQWYYEAQKLVRHSIELLTSAHFATNVIVIAHVGMQMSSGGMMKGFPMAVGKALGPDIPTYFSSVALCESTGQGKSQKRSIRTASTAFVDLANPAGFKMGETLPIETGLADFFKTIKG